MLEKKIERYQKILEKELGGVISKAGSKNHRLIYEQKDTSNDTFDMFFGIITGE